MRRITQQAFNEWVKKYYSEALAKIDAGEFLWGSFGKGNRRKGIILASTKTGKAARSYCHSDDKWDIGTGLAVAYARYMGVEIPRVEKTYLISELIGKEIMIEGNRYFITPYGNAYSMFAIDEFGKVYHLSRARVVFENEIIVEKEK